MIVNTVESAISRLPHIQPDSSFSPKDIVHMILAGGPSQTLFNLDRGTHHSAVEFLCRETRAIPSYPIPGGIIKEDFKGRPYFARGVAQFPANERLNEFLGILAVAGVHFRRTAIVTDAGTDGSLLDIAEAAMELYDMNSDADPAWSLMLFSVHPGVTNEWRNESGEILNVESILQRACSRPYGVGACFGTHLIEGVAFAVSRFCLDQDVEPAQLDGVWKDAWEYVYNASQLMKQNQKDDGSFDRSWFRKKSYPQNGAEWKQKVSDIISRRVRPARAIVYPTGHCLDALSPVSNFLSEDRGWLDTACYITAQTIESQWNELANEVSPITHAIHALKLVSD